MITLEINRIIIIFSFKVNLTITFHDNKKPINIKKV